jgi:hypothetical protein
MTTRLAFSNMSKYEEGETGKRLALWEDFELRRVLPLVPALIILDFSSKQPSTHLEILEVPRKRKNVFNGFLL